MGNVISTGHEVPVLSTIYRFIWEGMMFNLVYVRGLRIPQRLERGTLCICGGLLEKPPTHMGSTIS